MFYFRTYLYGFFIWFFVIILIGFFTMNVSFDWSREYFRIVFSKNSKIVINNSILLAFLTNLLIITIYFKRRFKENLKKSVIRALIFNSIVTVFFFGNCIFGR